MASPSWKENNNDKKVNIKLAAGEEMNKEKGEKEK